MMSRAFGGARLFSTTSPALRKVCVVGAAGGIGQPLSLLLKLNPNVTELSCYDVAPVTPGVAADLSHCNTKAKVTGFGGDALEAALEGAEVVVIPAGVPRKPGMTRDDLFNVNATIVANIAKSAAKVCPDAAFLVISNPVNSTVPILAEMMKKAGKYNPKKVIGVTTLDICRANTFVSENQGMDVNTVNVTVIGGHAGTTILPLLSQVNGAKFSAEDIEKLTHRIMFGGDEVVQAKAGGGSATLSMAFAGARMADSVIRGLNGEAVTECAFVESTITDCRFFSTPVTLGPSGVEKVSGFGTLSDFEKQKLDEMLPDLKAQVAKGVAFAGEFN